MTVSTGDGQIRLAGVAPQEDAERLLSLLLDLPAAAVDWTGCQSAHTAVLQVLLAARRPILGLPDSDTLKRWAAPAMGLARANFRPDRISPMQDPIQDEPER